MTDNNADKQLAQTLLALSMDLMSSDSPIPTARLIKRHFPNISPEAARKKLSRSREMLTACGLIIVQSKTQAGTAWALDPACYPQGKATHEDVNVIHLLTAPMLRDESFPHRSNLRFALMKLGGSPIQSTAKPPMLDDHVLDTVRSCLDTHRMLEVDYEDAEGNLTHRRVAPLGLFDFRSNSYLVCNAHSPQGQSGIRTLRLDRMSHARKTREGFEPPSDFDVNEYRLLPFQMGPTIARCTFCVPETTRALLVETTLGKGRFRRSGKTLLWDIDVSNFDDAASWAIAHGLQPVAPTEVVERWRALLGGCLS